MKRFEKPEERRRNGTAPLKEVIEQMFETYKLNAKVDQTTLISLWPKVMGPTVAKRTRSLHITGHTLYIKVDSAPLKHQLSQSRSEIIGLLNSEVGRMVIKEVVLI